MSTCRAASRSGTSWDCSEMSSAGGRSLLSLEREPGAEYGASLDSIVVGANGGED